MNRAEFHVADSCIGCGKCAESCPAQTIELSGRKAKIHYDNCIRCFCCQEFCPRAAMVAHRPLAAKVLNKLKL